MKAPTNKGITSPSNKDKNTKIFFKKITQSSEESRDISSPYLITEETIDLDLKNLKLEDLNILENRSLKKVKTISLDDNELTKINTLSNFPSLVKIEAINNKITEAVLKLPNLLELDLSNNQLTEVCFIFSFISSFKSFYSTWISKFKTFSKKDFL